MKYLLLPLLLASVGCGGGDPEPEPKRPPPAPESRSVSEARERAGDPKGPLEPQAIDPARTGSIRGVVFFDGKAPVRKPIAVEAIGGCKSEHEVLTEQVIVNDGRLQNVFVYVKRGLEGWIVPPVPSTPALLSQEGCVYKPHVQGIRTGQTLLIKNADPASHNVNARPRRSANPSFNQLQPMNGADLERVFGDQEIAIRFECNIHPWMNAYVAVVDHPFFAVSAADGSFELTGLPPGEYELEAWHEAYKRLSAQVTVQAGQASEAAFKFAP